MSRPAYDPRLTAAQLVEISEKLGAGFRHVAASGDIKVGATPRQAVDHDDKVTLYLYQNPRPLAPTAPKTPLLIVYALVNRPYMLDLEERRSMIGALVDNGVTTYLLDWGRPDFADQFISLEDYLFDYLDHAVDVILAEHDTDQLNLLGVCQGGVFSLCYTAARTRRVRNLVTMVTPVDFHTPDNLLSRWVRSLDIDRMVETFGNVPGPLLNWTFLSLKPFVLGARKYLEMIDNADDAERLATFMRMEKWINDSPDQAGAAFGEFVKRFFVDNAMVGGTFDIGENNICLGNVTQPIFNVIASRDHLVPPSASRPLAEMTASRDYTSHEEDAGHIGLFLGHRSTQKIAGLIANWLADRD